MAIHNNYVRLPIVNLQQQRTQQPADEKETQTPQTEAQPNNAPPAKKREGVGLAETLKRLEELNKRKLELEEAAKPKEDKSKSNETKEN